MEVRKYWEIFVRRKWLFIQAIIVILIAALLICFIPKRIYSIPAELQITGQDLQPQFVSDMPTNLGKLTSTTPVDNELETIESDAVVSQLINDLHLTDSRGTPCSPTGLINPSIFTVISKKIGISVKNPEDTDVITVKGMSADPEQAAAIANGLIQRYQVLKSQKNREEAKKAVTYITQQLPVVKAELTLAEETEQAFSDKEHLAIVDTQKTNLAGTLENLNSSLLNTRRTIKIDIQKKNAVAAELAKQPELHQATINSEANPTLRTLKESLYSLERELAPLNVQYTAEHPDVKSKLEQIEQTKKQIKEQIEKSFAASSLSRNDYYDSLITSYGNNEIELITSRAAEQSLSEQAHDVTQRLDQLDRKAVELARLERITAALRTRYTALLSQLQIAKLATQLEVTNAIVVSPAVVPTSAKVLKTYIYFPKRKLIVIIATLFSVMFGLFLVFFIEYLDDHIYRTEQIHEISENPILATIPLASTVAGVPSVVSLPPNIRDKIWELSIALLAKKGAGKPGIISILSQNRNEGKTFLTGALGVAFANQGKPTLLIDGNTQSPRLAELFQLPVAKPVPGLEPVPGTTSVSGLDILSSLSRMLLEDTNKIQRLIQRYSEKYSLILVDTPALTISPIGHIIAQHTAYTIFVFGAGISTVMQTQQTLSELKNLPEIGIVLNLTKK